MTPQAVDAAIHKCTGCGGWVYGLRGCRTCLVVWAYEAEVAS